MGLKLRLHIILSNFWQLLNGGFAESQPILHAIDSYNVDQSYPFDPVTVMVKEIQNSKLLAQVVLMHFHGNVTWSIKVQGAGQVQE
jgi:hypothetical protein